jgi:Polyketide cyclase / dehydrase and lipid transport
MTLKPIHVRSSRIVGAPPGRVYDILSNYRNGHPLILPARVFRDLRVERGGHGAGTVIRFGMKSFGGVKRMRLEVTEPEPGRVLAEEDLGGSGARTTFTVDPVRGGRSAVVIHTTWTPNGPAAVVERLIAPLLLKRLYAEELHNLDKVATGQL